MKNLFELAVAGGLMIALAGCSGNAPAPRSETAPKEEVKPKQAPEVYRVRFDTSKGPFVVEVHRSWSPWGADRFYELVQGRFYDGDRFFRVLKGFIIQWGINGEPDTEARWREMNIPDDPPKIPNARGTIAFAKAGPNSRTTQVFINLANNRPLDSQGFAPFGRVVEGMNNVVSIYGGYGEDPQQNRIEVQGNAYLADHYPKLDYIKSAAVDSGSKG